MAFKMKGFSGFKGSPAKQKYDLSKATVTESKSAEFDRKGLVRDRVGPVVTEPKKSWATDFSTWRKKRAAEKRKKTKKKVDVANETLSVSTKGYKRNSPDVNKKVNIIPSGDITMKGVDFKVKGVDNLGNTKVMKPGKDYKFPGTIVKETKYKK